MVIQIHLQNIASKEEDSYSHPFQGGVPEGGGGYQNTTHRR